MTSAASRRSILSVYRRNDACVFLYAFDLIELNGDDMRRDPLVVRKATLTSVLARARVGIRFNEHLEFDDGETVFNHACRMGLEGIVSKRKNIALSLGPLAGLAQDEECNRREASAARGGGGLMKPCLALSHS